ncbi:ABC transporter ATP-binding protein [Paraclostridium bifermentans]|uniref:ABC transporter ATP-binding protein n=2 Tax=Paraclostridium bifermentans TaxID=1490 RepID=UPI00359C224B
MDNKLNIVDIRIKEGEDMDILKVENIYKEYDKTQVVKGISLNIKKGEIFGLLGPNGAGKSTTISMITGLVKKTSGKIIYEENTNSIAKWKENIGLVPQDFALYFDLTAYENVAFFCSLYGYKRKELKKRVEKALEFVGLLEVKNKKASTFSGGMKRRLNIACAIAHSPKLIIMDEPTVGIDPQSRNHILESVKKLRKEGATIIYTSHYMEEVEELCDTIAIIDHGKVMAVGNSSELKEVVKDENIYRIEVDKEIDDIDEKLKQINGVYRVKVDKKDIECYYNENKKIIEDIVNVISKEDTNIRNMKSEIPSLETVFLNLTGKSLRD